MSDEKITKVLMHYNKLRNRGQRAIVANIDLATRYFVAKLCGCDPVWGCSVENDSSFYFLIVRLVSYRLAKYFLFTCNSY